MTGPDPEGGPRTGPPLLRPGPVRSGNVVPVSPAAIVDGCALTGGRGAVLGALIQSGISSSWVIMRVTPQFYLMVLAAVRPRRRSTCRTAIP